MSSFGIFSNVNDIIICFYTVHNRNFFSKSRLMENLSFRNVKFIFLLQNFVLFTNELLYKRRPLPKYIFVYCLIPSFLLNVSMREKKTMRYPSCVFWLL